MASPVLQQHRAKPGQVSGTWGGAAARKSPFMFACTSPSVLSPGLCNKLYSVNRELLLIELKSNFLNWNRGGKGRSRLTMQRGLSLSQTHTRACPRVYTHTHTPDILTLLSCLILFLITAFTTFFPSCDCGRKPVIYLASQPTPKLRPGYAEASPEKRRSAVCLLICVFAKGLWSSCMYARWHSAHRSLPSRGSVAKQRGTF